MRGETYTDPNDINAAFEWLAKQPKKVLFAVHLKTPNCILEALTVKSVEKDGDDVVVRFDVAMGGFSEVRTSNLRNVQIGY
jgi:hypothetical protein